MGVNEKAWGLDRTADKNVNSKHAIQNRNRENLKSLPFVNT
jgi:hypothetical protein